MRPDNRRSQRKVEHIRAFMLERRDINKSGFDDVSLVGNAIPELGCQDIDLSQKFLGKTLEVPILINAITGGAHEVVSINKALAMVAKDLGIAMAVGSQAAALKNKAFLESFTIARKVNPKGVLLANLSAGLSAREALEAIEMVEADGLQLHLNVAQELTMAEGDRDFRGWIDNIQAIKEVSPVPVIIKEVGFGVSGEVAQTLENLGFNYIDIGGRGGTNFVSIEARRRGQSPNAFADWGIPTLPSLVEVRENFYGTLIATGGLRNGLDFLKALVLGANLIGVAGEVLYLLQTGGEEKLRNRLKLWSSDLKKGMVLVGKANLVELTQVPVVIKGDSREWLELRGYDCKKYAQR